MIKRKAAHNILARIPVIFFDEDNKTIAYSPALDLSTYGDTEDQARKRFAEAVSIFIDEIVKMGTLDDILTECGWRKTSLNTWSPPVFRSCTEELVKIPEGV